MDTGLYTSAPGVIRCWWCQDHDDYEAYHDDEWGQPVADDHRLFEKICLEGFQSGLSWLTILRKRDGFRKTFREFDFHAVAKFTSKQVDRLLKNAAIIRHRGKIEATINNASRAIEMEDEFGSLGAYFWRYEPTRNRAALKTHQEACALKPCDEAMQMAKDLKKRGWKFVGPTTAYAFMQSMGMINDHLLGCSQHAEIERLRKAFVRPQS